LPAFFSALFEFPPLVLNVVKLITFSPPFPPPGGSHAPFPCVCSRRQDFSLARPGDPTPPSRDGVFWPVTYFRPYVRPSTFPFPPEKGKVPDEIWLNQNDLSHRFTASYFPIRFPYPLSSLLFGKMGEGKVEALSYLFSPCFRIISTV